MDPKQYARVYGLFTRARELGPDERSAFLAQACADDPDLRQEVEALLDADADPLSLSPLLEDDAYETAGFDITHMNSDDLKRVAVAIDLTKCKAPGEASHRQKPESHFPTIPGYAIEGIVGQGGMGVVYRAVQQKLNRTVALKFLPSVIASASPTVVARFQREARAAARLHHTNIVPIHDFGEANDGHYYAMDLVDGQSLDVVIRHFARQNASTASPARLAELLRSSISNSDSSEEAVDEKKELSDAELGQTSSSRGRAYYHQVANWMADAADALHYAHGEGITHRDIKPANLILSNDGRIMVADFGLAKGHGDQSVTVTGSLMGTLRYMSPEQAMAKRVRVDHRTDIYSLGATMYELLTFTPAFKGRDDKEILGAIIARDPISPRKVVSSIPQELDTICMKMLEKPPEGRYTTARALAEDLRRYINDLPIAARRRGLVGRSIKWVRRRKAQFVAGCAVALLVVTGALLVRAQQQQDAAEVIGLIKEGRNLTAQGEWQEAEKKLDKALELDSENEQAISMLAYTLLQHSKTESGEAERALLARAESQIVRVPQTKYSLNMQAMLLKKLGRLDEARSTYELLTESHPDFFPAWGNLGMVQALRGEFDSAEKNLLKARDLEDGSLFAAEILRNLAALQAFLGDEVSARVSLEAALERDKNDIGALMLKARIDLNDDRSSADHAAHAALHEAGESPDPKIHRILALVRLDGSQFQEALRSAQDSLAAGGSPAINNLIIAVARAHLGDRAGANTALQEALANWPDDLASPGDYVVTADDGILWFDTVDELITLRAEAERLISVGSGNEG